MTEANDKTPEEKAKEAAKRVERKARKEPVQKKVEELAKQSEKDVKAKDDELAKAKGEKSAEKSSKANKKTKEGIQKFGEKVAKNAKKTKEATDKGIIKPKSVENKDQIKNSKDKNKDQEKDKNKDKDKNAQKGSNTNDAKKKDMLSEIKLPSGANIRQDGPDWVIVSKDGKQTTPINDVMSDIEKYNKQINAVNKERAAQNAAISTPQKADDKAGKDMKDNPFVRSTEKTDSINVKPAATPTPTPMRPVEDVAKDKVADIKFPDGSKLDSKDAEDLVKKLSDPQRRKEMLERVEKENKKNEQLRQAEILRQKGGRE